MLVLTRKTSQCIAIGPDIKLTILKLERGRVKIGIDAPNSVRVTRPEKHGIPKVGDHGPNFEGLEVDLTDEIEIEV
jgi:carbon storage regulator